DRAFDSFGVWDASALKSGAREARGKQTGAVLSFDATHVRTLKMKVGVSFVGVENARMNLRAENGGWDFEAVRRRADATWDHWLGPIRSGGGTESEARAHDTAAYHAPLHP